MSQIAPLLKNKILELKDYSSEPLLTEEISELGLIVEDESANIDERILAARVMINVATNRKLRAERQLKRFSNIHTALVHKNERDKAKDSLVREGTEKLKNVEGAEDLLEALLNKLRKDK